MADNTYVVEIHQYEEVDAYTMNQVLSYLFEALELVSKYNTYREISRHHPISWHNTKCC